MLTLLSTLISFLMGGLPKLLDYFQNRADHKHEMEMARLQIDRELQMAERGFMAQARIEEIKLDEIKVQSEAQKYLADANTQQAVVDAQKAETVALYDYSKSLGAGVSQWVTNLRGSTQSIISLGFFLLLCAIDAGLIVYGFTHKVPFTEMAEILWDDNTSTLFASIIAFHFGGRVFGK